MKNNYSKKIYFLGVVAKLVKALHYGSDFLDQMSHILPKDKDEYLWVLARNIINDGKDMHYLEQLMKILRFAKAKRVTTFSEQLFKILFSQKVLDGQDENYDSILHTYY